MVDRFKNQIFEVSNDELISSVNKITEGPVFGLVGIMNILGQNYLAVIKEAQIVGKLYGAHIYKITEVKIYPFFVNPLASNPYR